MKVSARFHPLIRSLLLLTALPLAMACGTCDLRAQAATQPAASPAAHTFDATSLRGPTDLAAGWLVNAGDNLAFARPRLR